MPSSTVSTARPNHAPSESLRVAASDPKEIERLRRGIVGKLVNIYALKAQYGGAGPGSDLESTLVGQLRGRSAAARKTTSREDLKKLRGQADQELGAIAAIASQRTKTAKEPAENRLSRALSWMFSVKGQADGKGNAFALSDIDAALTRAGVPIKPPAKPKGRNLLQVTTNSLLSQVPALNDALLKIGNKRSSGVERSQAIENLCNALDEHHAKGAKKEAQSVAKTLTEVIRGLPKALPMGLELTTRLEPLLRAMLENRLIQVQQLKPHLNGQMVPVRNESEIAKIAVVVSQAIVGDPAALKAVVGHEMIHAVLDGVRDSSFTRHLVDSKGFRDAKRTIADRTGLLPDQARASLLRGLAEVFAATGTARAYGFDQDRGFNFFADNWMSRFLQEAREVAGEHLTPSAMKKLPWGSDPAGTDFVEAFDWLRRHPMILQKALLSPTGLAYDPWGMAFDDLHGEALVKMTKLYYGEFHTAPVPVRDELRRRD